MADFKIVHEGKSYSTVLATIASAEVIEAGDLVEASSGLPVKATATGARLAFAPLASPNGDTQIELTVGNDFILEGAGDAAYAVAQKGTEVDLVVNSTVQQIDVGTSSTDVFVVCMGQPDAVVGSTGNIRVVLNKPLY